MANDIVLAVDLGASSGRLLAAEILSDRIELHEVHRFENAPVQVGRRLHWDLLGLWQNIEHGIGLAAQRFGKRIRSIGVDTWGVDYVLLDCNDDLLGPAFCYRDSRTNGLLDRAFQSISKEEIFRHSGVQFMEINTLYQLWSMRVENSPILDIAHRFLMIPDFVHWQMTGEKVNEYTNASTTQFLDPVHREWSKTILDKLQIPTKLFESPVQPGTNLGPILGKLRQRTAIHDGCQVIVPATHDTGSAVIAVPAKGFAPKKPDWCYISCGTWSLMGVEIDAPILTDQCMELNFTNEGGAHGSVRLLKNIAGLWPFQQLRLSWRRRGKEYSWDQLTQMATAAKPFQSIVDIDHPMFVAPDDMLETFSNYLKSTGQQQLEDGGLARVALESLAMRYRICLEWLESLLGSRIETIHMVGGGVQNKLLCQMTADACDRRVVAGPVEATALGNVASQCIALGKFQSIPEVRAWMQSMPGMLTFEPIHASQWADACGRFNSMLAGGAG